MSLILCYNLGMTPQFIHKYFWDIKINKSDPKKHPDYFINRILEYGDKKSFIWLKSFFGMGKIRKVVKTGKLSPKSQNFWQNV